MCRLCTQSSHPTPCFAVPVQDVINLAGMVAANVVRGDVKVAHWQDLDLAALGADTVLLDVREVGGLPPFFDTLSHSVLYCLLRVYSTFFLYALTRLVHMSLVHMSPHQHVLGPLLPPCALWHIGCPSFTARVHSPACSATGVPTSQPGAPARAYDCGIQLKMLHCFAFVSRCTPQPVLNSVPLLQCLVVFPHAAW